MTSPTSYRIRLDPIAVINFTYNPASGEVTAPGIVPFTARSLDDARNTIQSLFDARATQ